MNKELCQNLYTGEIIDEKLISWLKQKAEKYNLKYLLAHAEDGVIWGCFQNDDLIIAHEVFPEFPKLRLLTLQQCRLFGEPGEVLLWQTNRGLKARSIQNDDNVEKLPNDEEQILLGTQGREKNGFTLLSDGQQGLKHAVPLTGINDSDDNKQHRPVRLIIRHYIDYNEAGVARIFLSRLVSLKSK